MKKIILSTLLTISLTAHAHQEGFGINPVLEVPNAVCKVFATVTTVTGNVISRKGKSCTGTLVTSPAFSKVKLVTAGHCFSGLPATADLSADCGCTADHASGATSCEESFVLNELSFLDDTGHDHAILSVDHAPKKIKPLPMVALSDFLDPSSKTPNTDVNCIKGGFGWDKNGVGTTVPNLYSTEKHPFKVYTPGTAPDSDLYIAEYLKNILWDEEFAKANFGTFSEDWIDPEAFQKTLTLNGVMDNVLQHGDSGSGLLCRKKGESYSLVAIYLGMNKATSHSYESGPGDAAEKLISTSVVLTDRYYLISPDWLKTSP